MAQRAVWLDRFSEPSVIRRRGVVEHVACRDLATGERRIVIATKELDLGELFDEIALLHGTLRHPHIPALDHRGASAGTQYVALRSGGIVDLETLLPVVLEGGGLAPEATISFLEVVIDAIRAAHATPHPKTGAPICIGAIAGSNILVSENQVHVIGWGYPSSESERRVVLRDSSVMHISWEASFGARATPAGDLDALARYFHAVLPASALPPALVRAVRGDTSEAHVAELVRLIAQLEDSAHAREPGQRSWDVYLATIRKIAERLDFAGDTGVLNRELARFCQRWHAATGLTVALDGSWFSIRSGARTELDRRPNLRAILAALVAARRTTPGSVLDPERLLEAGWPGEIVAADAGRNRVRVAVSTLRSLGLRELILSRGDGYLLDPDVAISVE
jgi:hypothetical protein